MQRASRRFEEKIQTITKLQFKHHKKHQAASPILSQTLQLPAIVNTLNSPSKTTNPVVADLNTLRTTSKQKIKNELDLIINQTLSQFKNQKVNRIIFASPLNSLGRTQYRASELKTIDNWSFPRQSPMGDKEKERRKRQFEEFLKRSEQRGRGRVEPFDAQSPQTVRNTTCVQMRELYLTAPDQSSEQCVIKLNKRKKPSRERRTDIYERYSPWRDDQQDEELLNWYK